MAKRYITLSKRDRARYRILLSNIEKIRNSVIKSRSWGVVSMLDAGPNTMRELPASAIPRNRKRKRFKTYKEFRSEMNDLKRYKSEKVYYRTTYKKKILDLWKEKIDEMSLQINGTSLTPQGRFGKFDESQIYQTDKNGNLIYGDDGKPKEVNKDMTKYMLMYNDLQDMSVDAFKEAYFGGWIVGFRFMYAEMTRYANTKAVGSDSGSTTSLDRQYELLKEFKEAGRDK